jgi:hypothetical protein
MLTTYRIEKGDEDTEFVRVRIFEGHEGPVAMLHRAGPIAEGAAYLFVPEGVFTVPAQLAVADKIAEREGKEVRILLQEVAWDDAWGSLH